MAWSTWLLFLWVEIVLAVSPGPAVLFVVGSGLRGGVGTALAGAGGILTANALWFLLSGAGVGVVLLAWPRVLSGLTWMGVAWLLWLAVSAFGPRGLVGVLPADQAAPERRLQVLRAGLLLQLTNPKALLFFVSILPGFVDPHGAWPAWLQILVFGATSAVAEFAVLWCYGAAAGAAVRRLQDPGLSRWIDRAAGLLLAAVAVWIGCRELGFGGLE